MIYNRKITLHLTEEQKWAFDGQSKKCNWLYNHLLDLCQKDYQSGNQKQLIKGRNLRDQVPIIKEDHPFLKTVHSSPLKNTALRLKDAYNGFFNHHRGFPKFRSWKKKWFSLYYDEPNKGFKLIDSITLRVSFGKNEDNRQIKHEVKMKEPFQLNNEKVKTLRITKDHQQYYAVFTLERLFVAPKKQQKTWIAFDPNHKNLMMGIDQDGRTFEFRNLSQLRFWDLVIDHLKSKRDRCEKKSRYMKTDHSAYWKPSRKWDRYNKALERAYHKRREQIKQVLYAIAHWTAKRYDEVIIGDYVPTPDLSIYQTMHRSMLNQTPVGKLRHTLEVQQKSGKYYQEVEEINTTKACCICGHLEKKKPDIRIFTCKQCGNTINRDINSSVNIAKKGNKSLPGSGYMDLKEPMYTVLWRFRQSKLIQQSTTQMNENKVVKI